MQTEGRIKVFVREEGVKATAVAHARSLFRVTPEVEAEAAEAAVQAVLAMKPAEAENTTTIQRVIEDAARGVVDAFRSASKREPERPTRRRVEDKDEAPTAEVK